MITFCDRCNEELPRSRVHIDGREYHLHCYRTEADWRELDRLAEHALNALCASGSHQPHHVPSVIIRQAYDYAEAMLAERKRRRET